MVESPLGAIGIGALVGIAGGVPGSQVLKFCTQRKWVSGTWLQIPVIALVMLCFGPRGLASIVFVVMVLADKLAGSNILLTIVTWTTLLSIALHGISANPLAAVYGAGVKQRGGTM